MLGKRTCTKFVNGRFFIYGVDRVPRNPHGKAGNEERRRSVFRVLFWYSTIIVQKNIITVACILVSWKYVGTLYGMKAVECMLL